MKTPADRTAYALAGVDVAAGEIAVQRMRDAIVGTHRPEVLNGPGGYGGAIAIPAGYREPVLVGSTDGVGTKTAIAAALGRFDTIGLDLVAMTADDVVCTGAEPLFLLDYVAVGRLDPDTVADIVGGIAAGCSVAGCALIGGETAEHPGVMGPNDFDLAATCVGIVERSELLDVRSVHEGDVILGLASSGLHANGFSLVRSLLASWELPLDRPYQEQLRRSLGEEATAAAIDAEPEHALATIGDVVLTPTRIYSRAVLAARAAARAAGHDVHAIAHITGGGLAGNVGRALPEQLGARIDPSRWRMPSAMRLIAALGGLDDEELRATFNGGIGMVVVVAPAAAAIVRATLATEGVESTAIGEVATLAELDGHRYLEGPLARA